MSTDETRSAVQGWKSMARGDEKTETRRERLNRERRENVGKSETGGVSREAKQRALREAHEYAEKEPENIVGNLRKAYNQKVKEEAKKKTFKGSPENCMLKMVLITENGGKIHSVSEAGFNAYKFVFTD